MDLYILNSNLRRSSVVDNYISLLWTERYATKGDFQLDVKATPQARAFYRPGLWCSIPDSVRVMQIDTLEDKFSDDGAHVLTVKGSSLEKVFEDRTVKDDLSSLSTNPKWSLTGTPGSIARNLFQSICVDGILNSGDILPHYVTGSIFPADTLPEPTDTVTIEFDPSTLYDALVKICSEYDLGFRLVLEPGTSNLYFNVYSGINRTSSQTTYPPIILSPDLDNIHNMSELISAQNEKNVAYVFSSRGSAIVYGPGVDSTVSGFDRRVLMVNTSEINDTTSDVTGALTRIGLEELAKSRRTTLLDGELILGTAGRYGVDYNVGDVVEVRNVYGETTYKRVTEFIFSSDREGVKAYPTLSETSSVSTLTWDYVDSSVNWDTYTTEHWADLP